ncbi:MAG: CHAT domain-containing protein [Candidatus Hodarchaeota archaeon]
MNRYADLEIGLHRQDADSYRVELRYTQPENETEVRLVRGGPLAVQFDIERLRELALDDSGYGQLLTENLFDDEELQRSFIQAWTNAQTLNVPLRLRFFIGPSAPELHNLRWETLRNPQIGDSLLTNENILFSRYLSSLDWRPVRLRPQSELRALVVIANPADVASYEPDGRPLRPLDVSAEFERVKSSLGKIPIKELLSGGSATINNLVTQLRDGYDILYLVCHGALVRCESRLWLEKEDGKSAVVNGRDLVIRLMELEERPRLVVLASCESAGDESHDSADNIGALATLGPLLAEAGIPAVLAMHGNITIQTLEQFMPKFFLELQRDGVVDRAMTAARGEVRDRLDWWMPVLFMRLKSGRIWYAPGFAEEHRGLEKWPALLNNIQNSRCTPILGPGLMEPLLGRRHEIAQRWAETFHFPMHPHHREDLPQVAQYLAVDQDPNFPRDQLIKYMRKEMLQRYGDDLKAHKKEASLAKLITTVVKKWWERDPTEPHALLAKLPLPIYITTNLSNLLADALADNGKEPRVEFCRWNEDIAQLPSIYDKEPNYRPDIKHPLVFHLFGHLEKPDSVVLTEDDYFDYLIGVAKNKKLIPEVVGRALTDTALLFLGFQLDDWNFRVLFRSVMSQEGRSRRQKYAHVAAQVDPEEGRIPEPERARRFLEQYFQEADISIYWGSPEDFMRHLWLRFDGGNK